MNGRAVFGVVLLAVSWSLGGCGDDTNTGSSDGTAAQDLAVVGQDGAGPGDASTATGDATVIPGDASALVDGASASDAAAAPDLAGPTPVLFPCSGCATFPTLGATTCSNATLAPPTLAYPLDGTLLPPNLDALEVQFVPPAGATLFEVDFENAVTDVRVAAPCNAITPVRGGATTGCGVALTAAEWQAIAGPNRDGDPLRVTVRATVDGSCVATSTASVAVRFAKDDLVGGLYYSALASYGGVNGHTQATRVYDFSAPAATARDYLAPGSAGTCTGCHAVSRDGVRLAFHFDDPDGDDEYGDTFVQVMDVSTRTAIGGKSISPGFRTFTHDHAKLVASTFKSAADKSFAVYSGDGVSLLATLALPTGMTGTQPELSADDASLVFVAPGSGTLSTAGDHHFSGSSLYTATFNASTNTLGAPTSLIASNGTDSYYYPSLSPDGAFVAFSHAPSGDVFFNTNSRVQLLHFPTAAGAQAIDLPALNQASGVTNSMPRWSPFVTSYQGHRVLWLTFASTRDYGLRLRNSGFVNCYPPESPAYDTPQPLTKSGTDYSMCTAPQVWMAGVIVDSDGALDTSDRSFTAFWLPFQDVGTHNYGAAWSQKLLAPTGSSCGSVGAACGTATCCSDVVCCLGSCSPTCTR